MAKKYTKKELVKLAKEFNKVMDFDNPIDVKADEAGLVAGIESEVDSLFTADKDSLSDAAWEYATKVLELTPEDGGTEGETQPEVEEEPPKETAAEKKARLKAEKKAARAADKPDDKKTPAATEKKKTDSKQTRARVREMLLSGKGHTKQEMADAIGVPLKFVGNECSYLQNPKYCGDHKPLAVTKGDDGKFSGKEITVKQAEAAIAKRKKK